MHVKKGVTSDYWVKRVCSSYPFGMLMPDRHDELSGRTYAYGFNWMERDEEVKGAGKHYSFSNYGYDPRLGRRWRPDPLQSGMPSWSPYVYTLDNPLMFIDEDGKWPGVTYFFFELDIGAGLALGLNYVQQSGMAYDEVGKTQFTMTSALYISNQNLREGSSNPELVLGASISLSAGMTQDWSHETFIGDISGYNGNAEVGTFGVYDVVGAGVSFDENRLSLKAGLGYGGKLSVINTQIKQSISLTDKEAGTAGILNGWAVNNEERILNDDGEVISFSATVATRNSEGKIVDTGIQISSGVTTDDEGVIKSDRI